MGIQNSDLAAFNEMGSALTGAAMAGPAGRARMAELAASWRARGMSETGVRRAFGQCPPPLPAPKSAKNPGGDTAFPRLDPARRGDSRLDLDWAVILLVAARICGTESDRCSANARAWRPSCARVLAIWIAATFRPGKSEDRRARFFGVLKPALRRAERRAELWVRKNGQVRAWRRAMLDKLGLVYDSRADAPADPEPGE